jgi:hypothetical protein
MEESPSTDLLLIACERAGRVECRPQKEDGSDAAVYTSSGATVARRIRAGAKFAASYNLEPLKPGSFPARFCWTITMQVGAARRTNYQLWLDDSPEEVRALCLARKEAKAYRNSLPHDMRKRKPWGPL